MVLENVLIISFFNILFYFLTLQYCTGFAMYFTCSHADFPTLFIEETIFSLLHIITSFVLD